MKITLIDSRLFFVLLDLVLSLVFRPSQFDVGKMTVFSPNKTRAITAKLGLVVPNDAICCVGVFKKKLFSFCLFFFWHCLHLLYGLGCR